MKASNFNFLAEVWPEYLDNLVEAEMLSKASPQAAAILCRKGMEMMLKWMFENDAELEYSSDDTYIKLGEMVYNESLRMLLSTKLHEKLKLVHRSGNNAAHKNIRTSEKAGMDAVKAMYDFSAWFVAEYTEDFEETIPAFDESLIPAKDAVEQAQKRLEELLEEKESKDIELERLKIRQSEDQKKIKELEEKLAKTQTIKEKNHTKLIKLPDALSEQETRELFIDLLLAEAGWDLDDERLREYKVTGMPKSTNPTGIGYVDYVLWGNNAKPLAVVEAKKTMHSAEKGEHQAKLYADCLEKQFGQRPVIFYTNGFSTHLWDDTFYPSRPVSGFYTKDQLEFLIQQRSERKDIKTVSQQKDHPIYKIAGRKYQREAIQRVAEHFDKGHRKALMVMATGTGKTRTAAALVKLLVNNNWAKKVLFLADRTALVKQAKNAFNEHLPDLTAIDLTKEKDNNKTRLVFSTYPTMMNTIDRERKENNQRAFTPGHFDLIIIDEAHRSVYQKYKAIFDYFDSMLIGLTATPKTEVDRNTYGLFDIENHDPTFAYELNEAVKDGFLVPPKAMSIDIGFQREGIKYQELSEEEKEEYEKTFRDEETGSLPDRIEGEALNKWLFNKDTVNKVLDQLMTHGLKVEGGDKLGKTIIFARNHDHAVFIKKQFDKNYPEYKGGISVIDNYVDKAQDLLERFCDQEEEQDPQIAISVDMMDTGVDAPRVVNLVFFKPVKSSAKYWQMIGRGTRLCPDLFGPGQDKQCFMIFDCFKNLEFFDHNPEGIKDRGIQESVSQKVFKAKLRLAQLLSGTEYQDEENQQIRKQYLDELHLSIANLDESRFIVHKKIEFVKKWGGGQRDRWEFLTMTDLAEIEEHLSHLPAPLKQDDEKARRFDLLIVQMQEAVCLQNPALNSLAKQVYDIAEKLSKKLNIPAVAKEADIIETVRQKEFWAQVNLPALEKVRHSLRDLLKFLDGKKGQTPAYTNFQDTVESTLSDIDLVSTYQSMDPYRKRVERYLQQNKEHMVIHKITSNEPITNGELSLLEKLLFEESEIGSKEEFEKEYGSDQPLVLFIRKILGLERKAAMELFADFLNESKFTADQITFINKIINHLTRNGIIDTAMLVDTPPFTDLHHEGIFGVFPEEEAMQVISLIDRINDADMMVVS